MFSAAEFINGFVGAGFVLENFRKSYLLRLLNFSH
jgi:hypothetical protein